MATNCRLIERIQSLNFRHQPCEPRAVQSFLAPEAWRVHCCRSLFQTRQLPPRPPGSCLDWMLLQSDIHAFKPPSTHLLLESPSFVNAVINVDRVFIGTSHCFALCDQTAATSNSANISVFVGHLSISAIQPIGAWQRCYLKKVDHLPSSLGLASADALSATRRSSPATTHWNLDLGIGARSPQFPPNKNALNQNGLNQHGLEKRRK